MIPYMLAGLFVVFYVLPKVILRIARRIDRYIHSSSSHPRDETLNDRQHEREFGQEALGCLGKARRRGRQQPKVLIKWDSRSIATLRSN